MEYVTSFERTFFYIYTMTCLKLHLSMNKFIINNSSIVTTTNLISSCHLHKKHSFRPSHPHFYPSLFTITSLCPNIVTTINKSFTNKTWPFLPHLKLPKNIVLSFQLSFPHNFSFNLSFFFLLHNIMYFLLLFTLNQTTWHHQRQ
jgi:hypothetical protein